METNNTTAAANIAADFNFAHLQIDEAVSRIDLPWVRPGAYLIVRPANEANKGYQGGMLALSGRRQRMATASLTADDAKRDRDDDRILYPHHVVVNWGGIVNREGIAVPFSRENVTAFLKQLPNWLFDKVRVHALRPENFVSSPDELPPNAEELAGN